MRAILECDPKLYLSRVAAMPKSLCTSDNMAFIKLSW